MWGHASEEVNTQERYASSPGRCKVVSTIVDNTLCAKVEVIIEDSKDLGSSGDLGVNIKSPPKVGWSQ